MTQPIETSHQGGWPAPSARAAAVFAALCTVLAAAYMIQTTFGNLTPKDFSYFWIAGQIWLEGGNPYAPAFSEAANAIAAANPDMTGVGGFHRWLYGPHIWTISTGLSLLDYTVARILWGVASAAAVLGGCYLALAAVLRPREPLFFVFFGLLALLASVTLGTAMSISTGQVASFTFLAVAAFVYGVLRGSGLAVALALIVLTMKPNLAIPFLGFALILPATRLPLVAAGLLSLGLSMPVVVATPLSEIVAGYLDGLSAYSGYDANAPDALTGLANLAHAVAGITLSGVVYAAIGACAGAFVGWQAKARGAGPEVLSALLAIACFCVPMHLYDMALIVLFLVLWPWPWWGALAILVNLAMLRVNRLGQMIGLNDPDTSFPGSFPATLLLIVLLMAAIWLLLAPREKMKIRQTSGQAT
jgi:hypothetical protein